MVNELGKCTAPGPPNDTCGPVDPPLIWTEMGQPGTGILLNDTLIMCSHASAGTNDTANLYSEHNWLYGFRIGASNGYEGKIEI